MRSKFKWIFTLLLAFSLQFSFAQQKAVSGVVSDATGPLPSANVVVKGTTRSVQTDIDGKFSIQVSQGEVLEFSYVGFKTQNVTVGASSVLKIALVPDNLLETVVIDQYRTTTKPKQNNAITTISAEKIEGRPNANFLQTLQGQVAGLNITSGSGQPGANQTVILRGPGSIYGNIEPLYVIDGIPLSSDNFRSINPNDIQSVSVLKDAGATAIYGNRGANGVIVVTTKRGGYDSALQIEYRSTYGLTNLQNTKYDLMNSTQLLTLERTYGVGEGVGMTDAQIAEAGKVNTNWNKYFFRTGTSQEHSLSLSAGSKNLASFTSIDYFNQEGILKTTDLNRFNFRSNINGKSENGKFNYATTVSINYSRRNEASSIGTGGVNQNFVLGANNSVPYKSPSDYVDSADLLAQYQNSGTLELTPLFLIDKIRNSKLETEELKLLVASNANYEILNGLNLGVNAGIDLTQSNNLQTNNPGSFNSLVFQQADEETGFQAEALSRDAQITVGSSLKYNKTFADKHSLQVGIFTEYNKGHLKGFNYDQEGLDPYLWSPGSGSGFIPFNVDTPTFYNPTVGSSKATSGLFSYFGNLDYDYDSRFGLGASIRRDASYRFKDEYKWGTFWSVSGRWNISNETFMEGSIFNVLKLRATYGTTGNQNVSGQSTYATPNAYADLVASGSGYNNEAAYLFAQLANPNLRWETIKQGDVGIDFELLKSRIRGVVDVYDKRTVDLYNFVPLSASTGFAGLYQNNGKMQNRGVELTLAYDVIRQPQDGWHLTVNGNVAYNKNKILEVPEFVDEGLSVISENHVLDEFYLVPYAGVNPANGNMLFWNQNHELTENPTDSDRRYTGKSALPVYQGSFGFDVSYQGFFASTQFNFVTDVWRFDYDLSNLQDPSNIGQFNMSTDILRAWTVDNRVTDIPSLNAGNLGLDSSSDRNLKDASYVRLRSATIGYDFPSKFLDKTSLKSLKIYAQAENYVTWSKWRGWDAESNRGSDQYQYPTPKIISFGLTVQF
jgi:TonB-linked SusC/RagA family outer membrane protein